MTRCPSQLTVAETKACVALIAKGGAVSRTFVEQWFPRSIVVAVKQSGAEIVGVGVIKPTRRHYTETVAQQSGAELRPEMHELGYVVVKEEHRGHGISRAIVRALCSAHEAPLFATTSNALMQHTLERFGFVKRGTEWTGGSGKLLSLWVSE